MAKSKNKKTGSKAKFSNVISLAKRIRSEAGTVPGPVKYKMKWNEAEKQASKKIKQHLHN